jgi:type IV pilus assembly protein PilE
MQHTDVEPSCIRHGRAAGFTLIELMIVTVVAAILAAVALPGFLSQIRSSRRSDAITALSKITQAQERYRANSSNFADRFIVNGSALVGTLVGRSTDTLPAGATAATTYTTTDGYYQLSLSGVSGTQYTVLATAQGSQVSDSSCKYMQVSVDAGNLTYNSGATSGTSNGATATANKRCWKK